jgi:apolipoprotein N-acyltransferase
MSIKIFVDIHDSRWNKYKIDFAKIVNVALDFVERENKVYKVIKNNRSDVERVSTGFAEPFGKINREISIILTNDSEIRALNKKYRGINKPTNVLSFETGDTELLGDIYISFDTTMRESGKDEFVVHTYHLVIHAVLHLLGYDHLNDLDAQKMESVEVKILAKLGIKNPYDDLPATNYQTAESREQRAKSKFVCCNVLNKSYDTAICYLLSAVFGGITALGFAPFNLWWATLFGIGGMYYLIAKQSNKLADSSQQRAKSELVCGTLPDANSNTANCYLLSAIFGAAYAATSFWWVLNSIYVVPELATQFAIWTIPGIIGIGITGALIFSIPLLVIRPNPQWNESTAIRPFMFAATWTLVLWFREWLFTGFPWNPIANISLPFPALANSMSLWGALGLTFIIVGFIASFVEFIKGKRQKVKGKSFPLIIFSILLIIGVGYGHNNIKKSAISNQQSAIIRIVQPAFSQEQKASHNREQAIENANENIKNLVGLARSVPPTQDSLGGKAANESIPPYQGAGNPDIIIFPETSYPFVIPQDKSELALARELNATTIIGATSWNNGKFYNSMIIANPSGEIEKIYSKSHLVPFGEYRPFGDIIPTPGQLTPGQGAEVIEIGDRRQEISINFVPAICYEIIFSDSLVPDCSNAVPACAGMTNYRMPNAVINITNDTWFGATPGTYQHLDMTRRQAIETGLSVVRANYSGMSAFISADGRVISSLPVGVSGVLDGKVWGAHMTPYRRLGRDAWMIIILAFSIICIFIQRKKAK